MIRKVRVEDKSVIPEQKQEVIIQKKMAQYSLQYLNEKYDGKLPDNEHLHNLYARLKIDMKLLSEELENTDRTNKNALRNFQAIYLELLEDQRKLLSEMNRRAEFDEELIRKYLSLIDLEEMKTREKILKEV